VLAWEEALERYEASDYAEGIANSHSNLGVVYRALGVLGKSQNHLQEALAIYRALDHRQGLAAASINLGLVYRDLGYSIEAVRYTEDALAFYLDLAP
jgi:tetratricopeptide (TPR) repeat protein